MVYHMDGEENHLVIKDVCSLNAKVWRKNEGKTETIPLLTLCLEKDNHISSELPCGFEQETMDWVQHMAIQLQWESSNSYKSPYHDDKLKEKEQRRKKYFNEIKLLEKNFKSVKYTHIERSKNYAADKIVNEVLDNAR